MRLLIVGSLYTVLINANFSAIEKEAARWNDLSLFKVKS